MGAIENIGSSNNSASTDNAVPTNDGLDDLDMFMDVRRGSNKRVIPDVACSESCVNRLLFLDELNIGLPSKDDRIVLCNISVPT